MTSLTSLKKAIDSVVSRMTFLRKTCSLTLEDMSEYVDGLGCYISQVRTPLSTIGRFYEELGLWEARTH